MSRPNNYTAAAWSARLLLLALVMLAGSAIWTPRASAGTYVIDNCPLSPTANSDPGPWSVFGAAQNAKGSCGGGVGDFIGPEGAMSPNHVDGVQVATPAGITIRHAKVWWSVPHQVSGADTFAIISASSGVVAESETPTAQVLVSDFALPATTSSLVLADYCSNDDAGAGCNFAASSPNLELYGSELTLADSALPTGAVTGGALLSTGALSGVQSMSYSAQDGSSGIRLAQLRIDGNVVAQKDYISSCPYSDFLACPPGVSDTISWDTASVADGEHSLELLLQSAAQNTSVLYSHVVHTENTTKPAALEAPPEPADTENRSSNPSSVSVPTPTSGANAGTSAEVRLGIAPAVTRDFAHRGLRLTGRLLDPLGDPIGGATLEVIQQVSGGAGLQILAHPRTSPDGTFSVEVGSGPSRTINVAYRAFSAEAGYAAQAKITETVGAGVQLKVTPRRTGPNKAITLSGTVSGPIPAQGVVVALLVHYRGSWEPFRTPRTDKHGHFHVKYQFQGGVGRFPFRAQVLAGQTGFPYGAGQSQVVRVTTG